MDVQQSTQQLVDAFMQAKAFTAALQSSAVELKVQNGGLTVLQRRSHMAQVLSALQHLHKLTTAVLIKFLGSQVAASLWLLDTMNATMCSACGHCHAAPQLTTQQVQAATATFKDTLNDWQQALPQDVSQVLAVKQATAKQYNTTRQEQLQKEMLANQNTMQSVGFDQQACDALQSIVAQLRSIEACVVFQAQLLQQAAAVSSNTGYSSSNFAYSSTPFSSWLKVHQQPEVASAIHAAMSRHLPCHQSDSTCANNTSNGNSTSSCHPCYMVWGSSAGWLALYAGLTFKSWRVVGVELLPLLVAVAQHVAQASGLNGVSFACGDLLASNISNVGVLMLTEQCWDADLIAKAAAKIKEELPIGSVVIDYTGSMGHSGLKSSFNTTVEVPVGWNERQKMHVYVKA